MSLGSGEWSAPTWYLGSTDARNTVTPTFDLAADDAPTVRGAVSAPVVDMDGVRPALAQIVASTGLSLEAGSESVFATDIPKKLLRPVEQWWRATVADV